jgi:hypothetical protein
MGCGGACLTAALEAGDDGLVVGGTWHGRNDMKTQLDPNEEAMPARTDHHFRAGDEVVVRAPEDILATLDPNGALDGLPFMPEMVSHCNSRFRVSRRAEKTCVEGYWSQRRFPANDVVFLEELRCSGDQHDGCKRGCMAFWKEAWLRPASPGEPPVRADESELERLRSRLKVKSDPTHYHCQSTQLGKATEFFPPKYKFRVIPQMVWVSLREIAVRNRSAKEVAGLMAHWVGLKFKEWRIGDRVLVMSGPNKRTPTQSLDLQPGERVKIKSAPEIEKTLDHKSMNRGLRIATAMTVNCGREYVVRDRVDRMILETTGEMLEIENTVSLKGLECLCYYQFGSCPRGDLQFWREIWLERSEAPSGSV